MSINCYHLRTLVVRPTLEYLGLWSKSAENLLLGTAAQESNMGKYLAQIKGPALGIYQMEPATYKDIWENFLKYRPVLADNVSDLQLSAQLSSNAYDGLELQGNLYYATAMARVHYLRVPEVLPPADNIPELASYWKAYYNTVEGKGTMDQFARSYRTYVNDGE